MDSSEEAERSVGKEICIFAVNLNETFPEEQFFHYLRLLEQDEQNRIMKYVNRMDRFRALTGALLARMLIVEQYGIPFNVIRISRNSFGKPYLDMSHNIHFNISHAGEWVVGACDSLSIGIDVEQIRPIKYEIAEHFFALPEQRQLFSCTGQERLERFYDLWTLKESYIKALGKGLSLPLNSFRMLLDSSSIAVYVGEERQNWHFKQYRLHTQYRLSVCAANSCFPVNINKLQAEELFEKADRTIDRIKEY